jgi:hypothetical protein
VSKGYDENRREFLRSLGRKTALGALVLGTGSLVARPGNREECVSNGICRGCAEVAECGLPQALSFKESASR